MPEVLSFMLIAFSLLFPSLVVKNKKSTQTQIVLYVCSRVVASFLPRAGQSTNTSASNSTRIRPIPPDARIFSLFAAITWGAVMWLFRERGETIQPGMFSSMRYLYLDSEHWANLRTLLWYNK
jgi:peroxisomal membrane protein 4